MGIKEIWDFIKKVVWPIAKPFICASEAEARELVDWFADESAGALPGMSSKPLPAFVTRAREALEKEQGNE